MLPFKQSRALMLLCVAVLLAATALLWLRVRPSNTLASNYPVPGARMSGFPRVFLWAWERPERLEFINSREVGVAFLAATVYLRGEKTIERPRLQPLKVPPGTTLIAVVRIESARDAPPVLSERQRTETVEALARIAHKQNLSALQIDFDATESEREFYRALLLDVRRALPESMPLSITALASWCIFDNWLNNLPLDEAVPMMFRMGSDGHRINNYLETGGDFRTPLCQCSVGVSTDETSASLSSSRRIYFFNPQPWSESTVRQALERSQQ
jgi:hypothetical protein